MATAMAAATVKKVVKGEAPVKYSLQDIKRFEVRRNAEANTVVLLKALESTKALRSSVEGLFTFLSCNDEAPDSEGGGEKIFLRGLQDKLQAVDMKFKEIGKSMDGVKGPYFADLVNVPLAWLNWDGPTAKDYKTVDNYTCQQWYRKVHEYSSCVHASLEDVSTTIPRTYLPHKHKSIHNNRVQQVTHNQALAILGSLQRHGLLKIQLQHTCLGHKVVKIGVDKVFIAYLSLWQVHVEMVNIKGYGEQVKGPNKDQISDEESLTLLNTSSQISLFRSITDHVNCAKLFYHDQSLTATGSGSPSHQLTMLVMFLRSYHVLFSSSYPCIHCKKHMKGGLPPYYRDFTKLSLISHKSCADKSFN